MVETEMPREEQTPVQTEEVNEHLVLKSECVSELTLVSFNQKNLNVLSFIYRLKLKHSECISAQVCNKAFF